MGNYAAEIPEGCMVLHVAECVRYIDRESGESHLALVIQDGDGEEVDDIATILGDVTLLQDRILQNWRHHNYEGD